MDSSSSQKHLTSHENANFKNVLEPRTQWIIYKWIIIRGNTVVCSKFLEDYSVVCACIAELSTCCIIVIKAPTCFCKEIPQH